MGDKRGSEYINLGALYGAPRSDTGGLPRPDPTRGPLFVSHEETLRRELAIINVRIAAELGSLPPGGLPVVPKYRMDAKGRPLLERADHRTTEEDAMKLNQAAAVAAITAAMAACEPQTGTETAERAQTPAPTAEQLPSVASETHAKPEVATVPERATTDAAPAVPDEIRAFVPPDSTLLAYKRFDLTGDGNEDAVLIVRHPVTEKYPNFSNNPCDLIVLHSEASGFKVAAKGSKVVDCTYRPYAREVAMKTSDLNDILTLEPGEIIVYEEADRPMGASTTYSFKHSPKGWCLNYAEAVFSRSEPAENENEYGELKVYSQIAKYPADIPFTSLSKFDPEDASLLKSMKNNQTEIK